MAERPVPIEPAGPVYPERVHDPTVPASPAPSWVPVSGKPYRR